MTITVHPGKLCGHIKMPPSKSQAHRILISAAFADRPTRLICPDTNLDILATAACLCALGAEIHRDTDGFTVTPAKTIPESAVLPCGESGTTLRLLLPVAGALGVDALFELDGRLPQRPLSPLWEEMERMGCRLSRPDSHTVRCQGKLISGAYTIDGSISSQFASGLLLAHSLMDGECSLQITGKIQSAPYIEMTRKVLDLFAAGTPGEIDVEGDWSSGAFFLAAAGLGSNLDVAGLDPDSVQGDKAVTALLPQLIAGSPCICAANIPDLVPVLAVVAAAKNGCTFTGVRRLRLKESDRIESILSMLRSLGAKADAENDALTVYGGGLTGGCVDGCSDHRIVMAAAIAATVCTEEVTISGADAVNKSYPRFWEEYSRLGGQYELNLR